MPKTSVVTHAATSAKDGTATRPIDMAVMVHNPWPNRRLVSTPRDDIASFRPGQQLCVDQNGIDDLVRENWPVARRTTTANRKAKSISVPQNAPDNPRGAPMRPLDRFSLEGGRGAPLLQRLQPLQPTVPAQQIVSIVPRLLDRKHELAVFVGTSPGLDFKAVEGSGTDPHIGQSNFR
jgi:hypothetical protein